MGKANPEVIRIVKNFKKKIKKKYDIKKMVLFGSQARGKAKGHSDVDLILVSPLFKKNVLKKTAKLYHEWHSDKDSYPVDFLCYSPEEFTRLSKRISIVKQANEEGIEI